MLALTSGTATVGERGWRPALWQVWLATAVLLTLIALPQIASFAPGDPDDFMRLLQVRDWLAGQSWWDVRQYRMDPPAGADMHWSRLVDLPLAAFLLAFGALLPEPWASVAAMSVVPLLQLGLAMVLLRSIMRRLGAGKGATIAVTALPLLFPLLVDAFMPLRIDHHGWQALCTLAATLAMLRGGWRNACAAGAIMAIALTISLEALPLAAVLGAIFALRFIRFGRREHEAYLVGLAFAAPLLFAATRPRNAFASAWCDQLSWPHFLALAAAAACAAASRIVAGQNHAAGRLVALVPVAVAAGLAILLPLGACAVDPFAAMDPVLRSEWLSRVPEGMPVWSQPASVAAMLLWTIAIIIAGARLAVRGARDKAARERWAMLALAALGAGALSLLVLRAGLIAQLLAVPFAAVLVAHYLPRARAIGSLPGRVLATMACLLLATPTLASAALKPLDGWDAKPSPAAGHAGPCDLSRLAALPNGQLFAPFDLGPEILARSGHSVVAGPYHRNQRAMRAVLDAFTGAPDNARAIVTSESADYLVACVSADRLGTFADAGEGNLADALLAGRAPAWLAPVPGFERGVLRVWRVR